MHGLPVGASEEAELHLVMDANVSKPIHAFYLLFFISFSFKRLIGGLFPSLYTLANVS
jgi:hypothetical protein